MMIENSSQTSSQLPTISYFLLNNGAKIPSIGLGTWQSGGEPCIESVHTALKAGYRHIDCAYLYGNEIEVGKALAEAFDEGIRREDLFLTSKLYYGGGGANSQKKVEDFVKLSLENLGVDYLDLYLVHWPETSTFGDATDPPWISGSEKQISSALKPIWKAMEDLVKTGLVHAIGVSNFNIQQISELLRFASIVPAVNQVWKIVLFTCPMI